jgi:hypothetical protein
MCATFELARNLPKLLSLLSVTDMRVAPAYRVAGPPVTGYRSVSRMARRRC